MDWGKKWLVDLNTGKIQLVSLDRSNNNGSIDVKMDGSVLEKKSSFKMLRLAFSSISFDKTVSKKIGAFIRSMKLLSPEVALYSINLPCTHVWNTVITPGLVPLVATWNC